MPEARQALLYQDLTQTTLTKVYLAWQRVSGHETAAGGRGEQLLHP